METLHWKTLIRARLLVLLGGILALVLLVPLTLQQSLAHAGHVQQQTYNLTDLQSGPITIIYDATGMSHISATSEANAYLGLCWAEAHDRLFQLDELRRAGEGRLAEIFGAGPDNTVLSQDELYRTLGLTQLAQAKYAAATSRVQADMSACATGINTFISQASAQHMLPPEFTDLGYTPETWMPWNSELIAMYFASSLDSAIYLAKIERATAIGLAGPQVADALIPDPPDAPSMFNNLGQLNPPGQFLVTNASSAAQSVPAANNPLRKTPEEVATLLQRLSLLQATNWTTGLRGSDRASNNWAVDGSLTASGKPFLANDPHLQLATPSLLYLAQLTVSGIGMNIEGLTIPGFPVFLSAHTPSLAYGITFTDVDDADLYAETLRQTITGEQVLYQGQWVPVQSRQELFQVAGASPVVLTIRTTPHGPILNDAQPALDALGMLALKTTMSQPAWTIDGFFALPTTQTWQQFRTDLTQEAIGLNFLFADNSHIAYQMAGLAPQRNIDNTLVPVPGGDGAHEWTSYPAPADLPSVYNPSSHLLVTANNRIVPDNYAPHGTPIYISRYWDLPWRAEQATTLLLQAGTHLTAAVLTHIQTNTQTVVGQPIAASLVAALQRVGLPANDPDAAASSAALSGWNGNANASSTGAVVYETLLALLTRDVVTPLLGSYQEYAATTFITTQVQAIQGLLESPRAPFFGASTDAQAPAARDQAVQTALAEADQLLRQALGTDSNVWTWGGLHTLTYNHPLAMTDPRFSIGTFPTGGDGATLNTGGWFVEIGLLSLPSDQLAKAGGVQAAFAQDALATGRVVWDMSNLESSLGILSTGESGNPASPHWSDQAALWRAGKYAVLAF